MGSKYKKVLQNYTHFFYAINGNKLCVRVFFSNTFYFRFGFISSSATFFSVLCSLKRKCIPQNALEVQKVLRKITKAWKKAKQHKLWVFTSLQNDNSPCAAFRLFLQFVQRACVWEFSVFFQLFLFILSPPFTSFVSTFHFFFRSHSVSPVYFLSYSCAENDFWNEWLVIVPYSFFALALPFFSIFCSVRVDVCGIFVFCSVFLMVFFFRSLF